MNIRLRKLFWSTYFLNILFYASIELTITTNNIMIRLIFFYIFPHILLIQIQIIKFKVWVFILVILYRLKLIVFLSKRANYGFFFITLIIQNSYILFSNKLLFWLITFIFCSVMIVHVADTNADLSNNLSYFAFMTVLQP